MPHVWRDTSNAESPKHWFDAIPPMPMLDRERMIRLALYAIASLIGATIVCVLSFTGGHQRAGAFSRGNWHFEYMINAPGAIRSERLEYLIVSDGPFEQQTIRTEQGKETTFTRGYRDSGTFSTVSFATKPGQTIWVGKDRKPRVLRESLRISDLKLLERLETVSALRKGCTVDEFESTMATLRKGPAATVRVIPVRR